MCQANREKLRDCNIFYDSGIHSNADPKHQWVIRSLRDPKFLGRMDLDRLQYPGTSLISTESITNELPFLEPAKTRIFVDHLSQFGDVSFLVVTRDPTSWALSYYRQAVVNQLSRLFSFYSTDLLFSEFAKLSHVRLLAERDALVEKMKTVFDRPVHSFEYKSNVSYKLLNFISEGQISGLLAATTVNTSLDDLSTELMRQLNSRTTSNSEKCAWAHILAKARPCGSTVLNTLAARATPEDLKELSSEAISSLQYTENWPLQFSPDGFESAKFELLRVLRTVQLF
jgi:hypothetical protein